MSSPLALTSAAVAVRRIVRRSTSTAVCAAALFGVAASAQQPRPPANPGATFDHATWDANLGGADSSQYSSLTQITKANVRNLKVAWTHETGGTPTFNPLVVGNVIYFPSNTPSCTARTCLKALNAATGAEIWVRPLDSGIGNRGMNYWQSADGTDRRLLFLSGGRLTAVNATTGEIITSFGENGSIAHPQSNNPGRIYQDLIILSRPASGGLSYAAAAADVTAYNILTGKEAWTFHTIARAGEFGADTWPAAGLGSYGGGHNWSESTVDSELGIVYIPTGTARFDFYGGNRDGANLFTDSLVALNARTGERLWHFQIVHHDVWDFDLPQAPKLLTVTQNGQRIPAVAQATKQGLLFVFNRVTGEPLWPIEERPVPQSDVPGEKSWPTQPFPTKPEPFARQTFTAADINPFLPEAEQQRFRELLARSRNEGLYTPPSLRGTIMMPGHNGGTNWGGSAVDPQRGRMFIVSKELPTYALLNEPGAGGGRGGGGGGAPGGGRGAGGAPGGPPGAASGAAGAGAPPGAAPGGRGGPGGAQVAGGPPEAGRGAAPGAGPPGGGRGAGGAPGGGRGGGRGGPAAPPPNAGAEGFVAYTSPVDFMQSGGLSALGPPWSQITAYDLNTGETMWQIPNGTVPWVNSPTPTGSHAPRGGPVATATGLLFVGTSSDRKFRAYDADNGREIWSYDLPAASEGVPAIYAVDGKQYIAVPVGGMGTMSGGQPQAEAGPGQYMVFALE